MRPSIWLLLFFCYLAVSSGWIYYFVFRYMYSSYTKGLLLLVLAFLVDIFGFSGMKMPEQWTPPISYALTGVFTFFVVWLANKKVV